MKRIKKVGYVIYKLIFSSLTILFLFLTFLYLVDQIMDGQSVLWPFAGLWLFLAYVLLPRIHRFLTKFYLPDYFIGRTRSGDGFFSDPVNIAIVGTESKLHKAMEEAGWHIAEPLTLKSSWKMAHATVRNRSYKNAPVSSLYLFGYEQDFTYQKEVKNNPRTRHHIRFWKVPEDWYLPGGYKANFIGAATFDKNVGISLYTGQITHKISEHTDEERDFVVESLSKTKFVKSIKVVKHFTTAFRHRGGGGDRISTDGSLPFIFLTS